MAVSFRQHPAAVIWFVLFVLYVFVYNVGLYVCCFVHNILGRLGVGVEVVNRVLKTHCCTVTQRIFFSVARFVDTRTTMQGGEV